jgi:hypothetical protein
MELGVRAQDVRQDDGVLVVGLLPGDSVPVAVSGDSHRIDAIELASGGPQAGNQESPGGLDRNRDLIVRAVTVLGEQTQQVLEARTTPTRPPHPPRPH